MFKILDEVCTPTKGTKYSACVDLYAREDVVINAGETVKIPLGVCIDEKFEFKSEDEVSKYIDAKDFNPSQYSFATWFKSTHYLQLMLRSSLGLRGLVLPNGVGIIDLDYKDEICMIIHYPIMTGQIPTGYGERKLGIDIYKHFEVKKGDKIAQIMLCEHKSYMFGIDTDIERNGGFGSTDKEKQ